jgi:hypothetical protein
MLHDRVASHVPSQADRNAFSAMQGCENYVVNDAKIAMIAVYMNLQISRESELD